MTTDPSLWTFIADAGFVVKCVMGILLLASIASWTLIFQRRRLFKQLRKATKAFEQRFWSGADLNQLFQEVEQRNEHDSLAVIFEAGLKEFYRLGECQGITREAVIEGVQRAMRIAEAREIERVESNIPLLATIGSVSPYVGLFGTVWGIMTSFRALGSVQQATIAMVAPGISEALIATAIGLFAAIPAVIAYNRFSNQLDDLAGRFELFQEELTNILQRQLYSKNG